MRVRKRKNLLEAANQRFTKESFAKESTLVRKRRSPKRHGDRRFIKEHKRTCDDEGHFIDTFLVFNRLYSFPCWYSILIYMHRFDFIRRDDYFSVLRSTHVQQHDVACVGKGDTRAEKLNKRRDGLFCGLQLHVVF
jgi:hypothetical protein